MDIRRCRLALASLALALALPLSANAQMTGSSPGQPQVPQPEAGGVNWKGAGVGAATLLANVGYIPAKTVYAILGGITGGVGYALTGGNQRAANSIWRSSLGGDYVLTPNMLRGTEPIHFSGPPVGPGEESMAAPAPSSPEVSANPAPAVASSATPVYPSTPASAPAGVGAPPLSLGPTSITGPADSGTGPLHSRDIE
jgi:hypothetical protein